MKFFILAFFVFFNILNARNELFMLPFEQDKAFKELVTSLKQAQESIDIAIYSFTSREIAKALRDSAKRGVSIRIIFDESSNGKNNTHSMIGYLDKYENIKVCLLKGIKAVNGQHFGIMHQKLAIIDKSRIFFGSANWTKNAFENSYETLFYDDDNYLVNKALKYYEEMFKKCKNY